MQQDRQQILHVSVKRLMRRGATSRRVGTFGVEMTVYDRAFCIPEPPVGVLDLDPA